jgi:peptide/nickel transport system substrate-binding protein
MDGTGDPILEGLLRDAFSRRDMLKRLGVLGASAALGGVAARTAGAATSLLEAGTTTLRYSTAQQPRSLDIATNYVTDCAQIAQLINEPLVLLSTNFQMIPVLATYSHPTPLKHVYKLRRGVHFSDGSPLTTEDVVWSLQRHREKKLASEIGTYFANVKTIKATGPNEVTVFMKTPDPAFPYFAIDAFILKKSFAEPQGKNYATVGQKMIGTGPFLLTSFSATGVTLDRNPSYWGHKPVVQKIELSYIKDPQTVKLAMRSGNIDAAFSIQPTDAADYAKIPGVEVIKSAGGLSYFLAFNVEAKPWSDVHVRRAVAHCWDAVGFVKGALRGLGAPSNGMVFPWQWLTIMSLSEQKAFFKSLPKYPFSIAAAKAELAKSSVPKGFSASVSYPSSFTNYGLALQSLAANLKQIGINLTVGEFTPSAWLNYLYGHKNFGMTAVIFGPDYADAYDFLAQSYPSSAAVPQGFNLANYKNPTADRLLNQYKLATTRAKRASTLKQLYRMSATDLPYLGLWYDDAMMAIRKPFTYQGFNPLFYITPWIDYVKQS